MKQFFSIIILIFINFTVFGQKIDDFKIDFVKVVSNQNFNETDLNDLFSKYSNILTPHSDITQLTANLKNNKIKQYPLIEFSESDIYKKNINKLFNSNNQYKRLFSYLIIASSGDKTFEQGLLTKIKTEKEKGNLIWSGMALLYLKSNYTTPIFDFLVKNETFGDAHMLPLFMKLDKDSLQNTAYNRINSDNLKAKILAVQIFSVTGKNPKTEKLVLDAVKNWDDNIKGYAIYTVKELRIGNLKNSFVPLLEKKETRKIALQALANSPTKKDVEYIKKITLENDTIPNDLLDAFYDSKEIDNIKFWLKLVGDFPINEDYYFGLYKKKELFSNELLPNVQKALLKTNNLPIKKYLIKALQGRKDKKSMKILMKYLDNDNSSVRYWTISSLSESVNDKVIEKLINILKNPTKREVSITPILIDKNIDTLQEIYSNIYLNEQSLDWKRSSVEYLSNFPKKEHKQIFINILNNEKSDFAMKRSAVNGLVNLKDINSTDLIIQVCENERKSSDFSNAQTYLVALSKLKGIKAKKYIESFRNSNEENIVILANKLLKEWK